MGLNLCYIRSTCAKLSKRMERHGADYKMYVGGKKHFLLCTRFLMNMEKKIVSSTCHRKQAPLKREGFHIQSTEGVNRYEAGRTSK